MRVLKFDDRKYGFPLDMDLHRYQDNSALYLPSRMHTIDFFEIMFLESGQGHYWANQYEVAIQPGTILFASPFQLKRYGIPEESVRGFHLVFRSSFLEAFFADKLFVHRLHFFFNVSHSPHLILSDAEFQVMTTALNEITEEIADYRPDSSIIIHGLLLFVLTRLNRAFLSFHGLPETTPRADMLVRFKQLLEEHVHTQLGVADYARALGVHRNVLNRQIKQLTGLTAKEVLVQRKIQEVKTRLLFSGKTIAEIAYDLDYSSPNNLTRFFSNQVGQSPSDFRAEVQSDRYSS
jgi:AraC family transcriptional regulator, transcriptional activator of pobA